jgi:C4-dicarboxylate-specific signal transduction histidine kinase
VEQSQLASLSESSLTEQLAVLERENTHLRTELEKTRKLAYLGTMATTVAHEFNQPVHIIHAATSAGLDDIKDNLFEPDEIKPLLERIHRQTRRLSQLIQNFRQLARSAQNQREAVNINQLLEQTIDSYFEAPFKDHNIHLVRQFKEPLQSLLRAWANPFQLQAVLSILLTNAQQALEGQDNAVVWVKTFQTQSHEVGFSIEDNGSGLAPEYRQHLFEPFVTTKTADKGTGLGLHLAYKIIQALNGQLGYQDRSDKGAFFTVTLPAYNEK